MAQEIPSFVKEPELLKTADVANQLRRTSRYVGLLAQRGKIAHYKFGRTLRFTQDQVDVFLKNHLEPIFVQPEKKPLSALDLRLGKF